MADDLNPVIQIQSVFSPAGIKESQAALEGLAASTNKVAPATNAAAAAQDALTAKQKVSTREIKVLTAELLRSIGVTQGAGAAGRVTAESFLAMGSAANYANLAMAGIGLAAVIAAPYLIGFVKSLASGDDETAAKGAAEAAAKAADDLRKSIIDSLPALESYARQLHPVPEYLERWVAAARDLALLDQAKQADSLADKIERLSGELLANEQTLKDYNSINAVASEGSRVSETLIAKLKDTIREEKDEIAALTQELNENARAANAHKTTTELRAGATRDAAAAERDLISALDKEAAYDKAAAEHEMEMLNFAADLKEADKERGKMALDAAKKIEAAQASGGEGKKIVEEARAAVESYKLSLTQMSTADLKRLHDSDTVTKAQIKLINQQLKARQIQRDEEITMAAEAFANFASLFGKNKAISVAAATVDTYAAADKAFWMAGGYPWGIGPMVATIAKGLANVAQIEKAGFDNPASDLIAETFGTKWASDMLMKIDTGFSRQLDEMSRGGGSVFNTTHVTNYPGTTVIDNSSYHSHAIVGATATQQLKDLKKKLVATDRMYNRSKIGGNT